ncbi:MAG: EamA family transporter [Alphaproteobacteria bacterium]
MTSSLPENGVIEIPDPAVAAAMPAPRTPSWLWLAIGTLFAWGFWAFLPKLALQSMQPHSVIFYEALGNLFVSVPVFLYLRGRLMWHRRSVPMAALISVMTVGAFMMYFFALKSGPVATIVTLTALYPVVAILLARVFLKEKLNRLQWLAVGCALCAALLLAV